MLEVNTYSPYDVQCTLGGYSLAGWEEVSISRSVQGFRSIRGIRGKNTRVRNVDSSATISISLIQTSPSNDVLSTIHTMDMQRGTGRLAITLKDKSGRSLFHSDEAYITGFPESVFTNGIETRIWTIFCQTTSSFSVGGNTKPDTPLVDSIVNGVKGVAGNIF